MQLLRRAFNAATLGLLGRPAKAPKAAEPLFERRQIGCLSIDLPVPYSICTPVAFDHGWTQYVGHAHKDWEWSLELVHYEDVLGPDARLIEELSNRERGLTEPLEVGRCIVAGVQGFRWRLASREVQGLVLATPQDVYALEARAPGTNLQARRFLYSVGALP